MEIVATVFVIIWLLGWLSSYTLGGAIHFCLLAAALCLLAKYFWWKGRPERSPTRVRQDQRFG